MLTSLTKKDGDILVDVNASDTDGTTPLMIACMEGHKEIVELLTSLTNKDGDIT